jgi:hypothetical protein
MSLRENQTRRVDRLTALNDPGEAFKNPAQLGFIRTLVDIIRRMSNEFVSQETASPFFLLQAPGGVVYRVTVNDAGALVVTNART